MSAINFFNSMDHLEPKCPNCGVVLQYGENTDYDEKSDTTICLKCKSSIE